MGKLNKDFSYHRAFDIAALLVFVLFLALFAKSIVTVVGAFETEVYTNTIAELGKIKLP